MLGKEEEEEGEEEKEEEEAVVAEVEEWKCKIKIQNGNDIGDK